MPKLADLEIKDNRTALVASYNSDVAHIGNRLGVAADRTRYWVTACNRALETPVKTPDTRFWQEPDKWRWRICPRCGSVTEYDAAFDKMQQERKEAAETWKARRAAEEAERERQWNEQQGRLEQLCKLLLSLDGLDNLAVDDERGFIRLDYGGRTYTITEE